MPFERPNPTTTLSEHERLIQAWRRGDVRVTERLYEDHRDRAYKLAFSLLRNTHSAEDIAQESLTFALLNPKRFDPDRGRFSAWVAAIVVRSCRTHLKTQKRRKRLMFWAKTSPTLHAAPQISPEEESAQHQTQNLLWDAVQTLSPRLKEAVILRIWGEHTYPELSVILRCPQRTAQSRVRLGLAALRQHLQHDTFQHLVSSRRENFA